MNSLRSRFFRCPASFIFSIGCVPLFLFIISATAQGTELSSRTLDSGWQFRATGSLDQIPSQSQADVKQWHAYIDDPTLADAILDRIVHNAYHLDLSGDSVRKLKSMRAKNAKAGGTRATGSPSIAAPEPL